MSSAGAAPPPPVPALAQGAAPAGGAADATNSALRRVVKKASLELVVSRPGDAAAAAGRAAEREGGFVASTERDQTTEAGKSELARLTLTIRVPADRFTATLEALRRLGSGDGSETVTTDDVSEEFIDLDARLKNQRELEAQFLQILKQATKVDEALNVQRELMAVRTEIDRMEGRRRFLDRETSLATITLVLVPAPPFTSAGFGDFGSAVKHAASDAVNESASLVTGSIRLLGFVAPIVAFFGAPVVFAMWLTRRRRTKALRSA
ncbi:MAG TPA: DUF4349 domain-containing protein [Polyangiaceae bacterium]|nr:DUF4349 domain-containing protein [Polyangiaceae bacterium]